MVVGVVQFDLFMPHNHSLKEKRHILLKLKDRVLSQMKIILNEVGDLDLWQRATLGFAVVGNEEKILDSLITRTMNFIVSMNFGEISAENRDMIHYE
jgi:uncharacterized protein